MKLKLILAVLLCAIAAPIASAQVQPFAFSNNALAPTGTLANSPVRMVTNATIRVCNEPASGTPCTPLASIYSDAGLSVPLANPFQADFYGNYTFFVPAGQYHVQQSGPQVAVTDIPYIVFGVGGGGGGGTPCGAQFDVQINNPLGTFGCDTGIFQEFPNTHTVIDYIGSFGQQVNVSDATHTGLIDLGHSNGTVVDSHFQMSLSSTFSTTSGGYGIDWPDSPALGALVITSLVPGADGHLQAYWSASGGTLPCGATYDVQLNISGSFGCDTGIFTENPSTHTMTDQFIVADRQVTIGDATHTGVLSVSHTNGTSADFAFNLGLNSTFSATYGIDLPDTAAVGNLRITSLSPGADGRLPTMWSLASNGVSCEDWFPVWHCNANAPATTSDITPSANSFQANLMFASPLIPTDPASYLVQATNPASCVIASVGTVTCQINAVTPGDTLVVMSYVQCGLGCSGITFATSDAAPGGGNTWTQASTSDGSGSSLPYSLDYAPITHGGNDTVTVVASPTGANYNTQIEVFEVKGAAVPDVIGSEHASVAPTSYAFNALTTTHAQDFLLACVFQNDAASTYTQGSGWYLNPVMQGGLAPFASMGCEVQNQSSIGTYTPTMSGVGSGSGYSLVSSWQITSPSNFGTLNPRWWRYQDAVAGGDFPDSTGQSGKALVATSTPGLFTLSSVGAGSVTSVSGTTSQIDVATGTTTPVVSLDGQFTSVNYATCTNTADALSVTLSPAPTALVNGLTVQCKASAANTTTTPTLIVNALGSPHTIVKGGSTGQQALVANDILTNMTARFTYNATATTWELQNPQQLAAGSGTVTSIATTSPLGGGTITTTGTLTCTTCVVASSPGVGIAHFAGSTQTVTSSAVNLAGADVTGNLPVTNLNSGTSASSSTFWRGDGTWAAAGGGTVTLHCQTGLGDGTNAITGATYLQSFCYNDSGSTWTITGVKCYTDNSGSSTVNLTNGSGTALLTGAITCSSSWAAGTQSGTTTIAAGDYIKFTFVADGTSKQTTWAVGLTQ